MQLLVETSRQGRCSITITGLRPCGAKPAATYVFGDPGQATTDLTTSKRFVVSAPPDPAGPTQVLVRIRTAGTKAFLMVQYWLSTRHQLC